MNFDIQLLEDAGIQLIDGDRGKNYPKQEDFSDEGFCLFLSAKNVTKTGFEFSERVFISSEKDDLLRAGKLTREDIVVTTRGTIGNIAFYSGDIPYDNVRINSGMMIFRADESKWNRRFLYFLLTSEYIQNQIISLTSGSAVPQLPARDLKKFRLPKIPKNIQNDIDSVVSSLAEKIQLNRQINQTLEQMAQAIFQSWFVDFEPVKAKIAAREDWLARQAAQSDAHDDAPQFSSPVCYAHEFADAAAPAPATQADLETVMNRAAMCAISGKTDADLDAMPAADYQRLYHTASLFPDELVESELGEIPKGWAVKRVSDFGKVVCGKTPSKAEPDNFGDDVPFIKIPDMHSTAYVVQSSDSLSFKGAESQKNKTIPPGSVCVSCIATVGKVVLTHEFCQTNQQINSIVPSLVESAIYLYFQMKSKSFLFHELASGGSATLNMNTTTFSNVAVLSPEFSVLNCFHENVSNVFAYILLKEKEIVELSGVRDALLPKLLSGELDLSALTELVDNAAEPGTAHV